MAPATAAIEPRGRRSIDGRAIRHVDHMARRCPSSICEAAVQGALRGVRAARRRSTHAVAGPGLCEPRRGRGCRRSSARYEGGMKIDARTVVITGASSGIGRASAVRLARSGFRVYAGIRAEADAAALRAEHPAIEPIAIDVTDATAIAAARQRLERELDGLGGLVNNAGIGLVAPME